MELIVALVTPFRDGKIDYFSLENLIKSLETESDGLLLLGSTGEARLIEDIDKVEIVEFVRRKYKKKLIVGLEGKTVEEIVGLAKMLKHIKIDSYLISPISYIRPTKTGIINFYMELADRLDKPIILYEIPKRCGCHIGIEEIKVLKNHKKIIGIKNANPDSEYMIRLFQLSSDDFRIYTGDDIKILTGMLFKSFGLFSVMANKYPSVIRRIIDDYPKCDEFLKYYDLFKITMNSSPLGIKYLLGNMEASRELGLLDRSTIDEINNQIEKLNI